MQRVNHSARLILCHCKVTNRGEVTNREEVTNRGKVTNHGEVTNRGEVTNHGEETNRVRTDKLYRQNIKSDTICHTSDEFVPE